MRNRRTSGAGFTLIELMIVVTIIGIISAIAYPSYTDSVRKSRRAEGKALLLDAANRQERQFADSTPNAYTTNITTLGYSSTSSENGYYTLSATTDTGFKLTVTASGAQAVDSDCASMSLNALGQKTSTGGGKCW